MADEPDLTLETIEDDTVIKRYEVSGCGCVIAVAIFFFALGLMW